MSGKPGSRLGGRWERGGSGRWCQRLSFRVGEVQLEDELSGTAWGGDGIVITIGGATAGAFVTTLLKRNVMMASPIVPSKRTTPTTHLRVSACDLCSVASNLANWASILVLNDEMPLSRVSSIAANRPSTFVSMVFSFASTSSRLGLVIMRSSIASARLSTGARKNNALACVDTVESGAWSRNRTWLSVIRSETLLTGLYQISEPRTFIIARKF